MNSVLDSQSVDGIEADSSNLSAKKKSRARKAPARNRAPTEESSHALSHDHEEVHAKNLAEEEIDKRMYGSLMSTAYEPPVRPIGLALGAVPSRNPADKPSVPDTPLLNTSPGFEPYFIAKIHQKVAIIRHELLTDVQNKFDCLSHDLDSYSKQLTAHGKYDVGPFFAVDTGPFQGTSEVAPLLATKEGDANSIIVTDNSRDKLFQSSNFGDLAFGGEKSEKTCRCGYAPAENAIFCMNCGRNLKRCALVERLEVSAVSDAQSTKLKGMLDIIAKFLAREQPVKKKDNLKVTRTFKSDNKFRRELKKGTLGVVSNVDMNMDIQVEFEGVGDAQWVCVSKQKYLTNVNGAELADLLVPKLKKPESHKKSTQYLDLTGKKNTSKNHEGSFKDWTLEVVIAVAIVINSIIIGLQVELKGNYIALAVVDGCLTFFFFCEFWIKVYFAGFKHYFSNGMNIFDFTLMSLDVTQACLTSLLGFGSSELSAVAVFRAFRLVKVMKLVRKYVGDENLDTIRKIIDGISGGMPSLGWSCIILALIIYLVAVTCCNFLGKANKADFDSIPRAAFTVFQCSFGECNNWKGKAIFHDVWNLYGVPGAIGFASFRFIVTAGIFNVISAIFVDAMTGATKAKELASRDLRLHDEDLRAAWIAVLVQRIVNILRQVSVKNMQFSDNPNANGEYEYVGKEMQLFFDETTSLEEKQQKYKEFEDFYESYPEAKFMVYQPEEGEFQTMCREDVKESIDEFRRKQKNQLNRQLSRLTVAGTLAIVAWDDSKLVCFRKVSNDGFLYRYLTDDPKYEDDEMYFWYIGGKIHQFGSPPDDAYAKAKNDGAFTRPPSTGWTVKTFSGWEESSRDLLDPHRYVPHVSREKNGRLTDPLQHFYPSQTLRSDAAEFLTRRDWFHAEPLSWDDFDALIQDDLARASLQALDIDTADFNQFHDMLDPENDGLIPLENIVCGLCRLRGVPTRGDIITVDLMLRDVQDNVNVIKNKMSEITSDITALREAQRHDVVALGHQVVAQRHDDVAPDGFAWKSSSQETKVAAESSESEVD